MKRDTRRFCQSENCTRELPITAMPHKKFCDICAAIRKRKRIDACYQKKKREMILLGSVNKA
jgi:hypothetical protein